MSTEYDDAKRLLDFFQKSLNLKIDLTLEKRSRFNSSGNREERFKVYHGSGASSRYDSSWFRGDTASEAIFKMFVHLADEVEQVDKGEDDGEEES